MDREYVVVTENGCVTFIELTRGRQTAIDSCVDGIEEYVRDVLSKEFNFSADSRYWMLTIESQIAFYGAAPRINSGVPAITEIDENKKEYWITVRFLQSCDEDYNRVEAVFCGLKHSYCEGNSQPVIDYLSDWDDSDCELKITNEEPCIGRTGDTSYADENGLYTLLYNSSLGGVFLLYRKATEDEIDWYKDHNKIK